MAMVPSSGWVTFMDGFTRLGIGTLNGNAVATFRTSSLGAGTHAISAVYRGDTRLAAGTGTATQNGDQRGQVTQ